MRSLVIIAAAAAAAAAVLRAFHLPTSVPTAELARRVIEAIASEFFLLLLCVYLYASVVLTLHVRGGARQTDFNLVFNRNSWPDEI